MGPLAVSLPCPYRIMSVCRSAAAKNTRLSPTLCTSLERMQVTSAIADRAALNEVHRQGSCGRGHVPTLGPQQWQVNHACADGHAAALSACL